MRERALQFALLFLLLFSAGCPQQRTAKAGDNVSVDYVLRLANGSIADSSNGQIAVDAGVVVPGRLYEPLAFTIGQGGLLPKFEQAVIGMREGESREVAIPPSEGYGDWDPSLVQTLSRFESIPRVGNMPATTFAVQFGGNATVGRVLSLNQWNATVISADSNTVLIRGDPLVNDTVIVDEAPFPLKVFELSDDYITLRLEASAGDKGKFYNAQAGGVQHVKVLNATDSTLTLDFNHDLAGETLIFNITLVKIH